MVMESATLGGGCFWCIEAVFQNVDGVASVTSGYCGGEVPNPTYREVCAGTTGHAEVAQICFDNEKTSFAELLELFWRAHDPTTLNRQGADVGSQYRSAIFYHDENQKQIAEQSLAALNQSGLYPNPAVTQIAALPRFYPAEDYHQDYYRNNSSAAYCRVVIQPKLNKLGMPS